MPFLTNEDRKFFEEEGYFIIRNVYDQLEVQKINDLYQKLWIDKVKNGLIRQDPKFPMESLFPTLHEIQRENEELKTFMLEERNFAIAEEILGSEPLLIGTTCFFKAPQTKALPFHQDNVDNGCIPDRNVALWVSLDGSDPSNGSLCFIPRSHKNGLFSINLPATHPYGVLSTNVTGETGIETEVVHIETDPGDVVIFDGNTIHGSNSNSTDTRFRRSFAMHFTTKTVEKVFANFTHLYNKSGEVEQRPVNKKHGKIRSLLLPPRIMEEGDKIY
ncbi:phytanoyl-CoA dioxygenase family protein [Fictibacillus sp. KIGAM418]|uniref:Phytanoyl-CoA dioxygenase family protein n=1 Tax=Fictibacillus marinisediminis TaxID=2878389 RepID=A0A9X1XET6_9BACL|nr:phytanoyl-CoA dioxygenase family protein [Fictibacillus marinisediminis]MCK6259489.1 phytanoyl-CoA dioxygenase family protein [Fictibacillus marinisediminis]